MRRRVFIIVFLAAAVECSAQPAVPSRNSRWTQITSLSPGTAIRVRTAQAKISCKLLRADAESLTCAHRHPIVIPRAEILSVTTSHGWHSKLWGVAAWGSLGAATGALIAGSDNAVANTPQQRVDVGYATLISAGACAGISLIVDSWPHPVYKTP